MSDKLLSRFLRYVQIDTQSDETSNTFPSTPGQLVLLEMLKQELSKLGAADVQMTKHGYVMASVPAKTRKAHVPTVAFLAHVDTAPDCSGKGVKPIVHRKYNGSVIKFPDNRGLTLDPATSPELRTALGKDIVTSSGTTGTIPSRVHLDRLTASRQTWDVDAHGLRVGDGRGEDRGRRTDNVHQPHREQGAGFGPGGQVDAVEIRRGAKGRLHLVAMGMAVQRDLLIGISVDQFGGAAFGFVEEGLDLLGNLIFGQ